MAYSPLSESTDPMFQTRRNILWQNVDEKQLLRKDVEDMLEKPEKQLQDDVDVELQFNT